MSELEFEAITVVDAQVVNANAGQMDNVTITELQAHRGDGADPLQNTWKLKPLYISSKVKRLNATGGISKLCGWKFGAKLSTSVKRLKLGSRCTMAVIMVALLK